MNKQFELLEFVFDSVYVDLQYDERFLSLLLLGLCPSVVSVVMWSSLVCLLACRGTHVDAVVAVTVMRVLLFVLHVCILRKCDGARLTAMLVWGWMRCCCGRV